MVDMTAAQKMTDTPNVNGGFIPPTFSSVKSILRAVEF